MLYLAVGNSKNIGVGHYFMSKLRLNIPNGAHYLQQKLLRSSMIDGPDVYFVSR